MGFDRYRERGVSHGVKDSYDFTDHEYAGGIVRSSSLVFVTTLVGIHIDEHDWIGSSKDSHGNDIGVPILLLVDLRYHAFTECIVYEYAVILNLSL